MHGVFLVAFDYGAHWAPVKGPSYFLSNTRFACVVLGSLRILGARSARALRWRWRTRSSPRATGRDLLERVADELEDDLDSARENAETDEATGERDEALRKAFARGCRKLTRI